MQDLENAVGLGDHNGPTAIWVLFKNLDLVYLQHILRPNFMLSNIWMKRLQIYWDDVDNGVQVDQQLMQCTSLLLFVLAL